MAHLLDALHGLIFLLRAIGVAVHGIQVAVDELDGFEDVARRQALPHFAEAAGAQWFDETVTGNGFRIRLAYPAHGRPLSFGARMTGCAGFDSGNPSHSGCRGEGALS